MVLFCATLLVSEWARRGIEYLARRYGRQSHGWELAVTATCLAALFVYHNQRIYSFITHTASREFFLTADEEELRDWLRRRDASLGKYTLATASHELNYLAAYWTHADLLLPEGFPLHSVESNAEIEERMARLLAIYGATPASWLDFNLHRHVWDQWSWSRSQTPLRTTRVYVLSAPQSNCHRRQCRRQHTAQRPLAARPRGTPKSDCATTKTCVVGCTTHTWPAFTLPSRLPSGSTKARHPRRRDARRYHPRRSLSCPWQPRFERLCPRVPPRRFGSMGATGTEPIVFHQRLAANTAPHTDSMPADW